MQHAIGDHALLADGRTAALIAPDGDVAWLCWPRVDSSPMLLSILDGERGGCFSVRPADARATVVSRGYRDATLVLATGWSAGAAHLVVDDALAWDGPAALLRRVRARDGALEVEVRFRPAFDAARAPAQLHADGGTLVASGAGLRLRLRAPGEWRIDGTTAVQRFSVAPDGPGAVIVLSDASGGVTASDAVDATIDAWRRLLAPSVDVTCNAMARGALGGATSRRLLKTSIAVLLGLRQREGGIVAAPTTSLPQWPGSQRTWDYRYCWMRDAALAAIALARAGQRDAASDLGAFLGRAVLTSGLRPVYRVDGSAPPHETILDHLGGYGGAKPVRIGNAAAAQTQLDAPAELVELTMTLAGLDAVPEPLAAATSQCAAWIAAHWDEPDHGIWEIRGAPSRYTHSRAMAAAALGWAAALADRTVIAGNAAAWREASVRVQAAVLRGGRAALELRDDGGGADAALAQLARTGLLAPDDPLNRRTLRLIEARLDRDGLLERYEGSPDELADPCGPFVFPTFWMAGALQACGTGGGSRFRAAATAAGRLGLFGEVVDPRDHTPLGNYPQVQSHAAFIVAATDGA